MIWKLLTINDNLFQLKRSIKEVTVNQSKVKDVNDWKDYLKCTHVFRKDGYLHFCNSIDDIEYEIIQDKEKILEEVNSTSDLNLNNDQEVIQNAL